MTSWLHLDEEKLTDEEENFWTCVRDANIDLSSLKICEQHLSGARLPELIGQFLTREPGNGGCVLSRS